MRSKSLITLILLFANFFSLRVMAESDDSYCVSNPQLAVVSSGKYTYLGYNCHNFANDFCEKSKLDARILACQAEETQNSQGGHTLNVIPSPNKAGDVCFIEPQSPDGDMCCFTPNNPNKKDACGSTEIDLTEASASSCYFRMCGDQAGYHYNPDFDPKKGQHYTVPDGAVLPKGTVVNTFDVEPKKCIPLTADDAQKELDRENNGNKGKEKGPAECEKCCDKIYDDNMAYANEWAENSAERKKEQDIAKKRNKMCKESCQRTYNATLRHLRKNPPPVAPSSASSITQSASAAAVVSHSSATAIVPVVASRTSSVAAVSSFSASASASRAAVSSSASSSVRSSASQVSAASAASVVASSSARATSVSSAASSSSASSGVSAACCKDDGISPNWNTSGTCSKMTLEKVMCRNIPISSASASSSSSSSASASAASSASAAPATASSSAHSSASSSSVSAAASKSSGVCCENVKSGNTKYYPDLKKCPTGWTETTCGGLGRAGPTTRGE